MSIFLKAEWRKLILAQYEVEPSKLMTYLPAGLKLDLFHDRCYVSLVGFLFDRVRLKGFPIPLHTSFEEINLRFYVKRHEPDGTTKRGVVFIREFVPRMAIAVVAKRIYEEPYKAIPTTHKFIGSAEGLKVEYGWKYGGRWHSISALGHTEPMEMESGSVEDFITEHYWGYTKRRGNATSAYEIRHPRWQVYKLKSYEIEADFGTLYGPEFANLTHAAPSSVILAEGSKVSVHSGFRLPSA